MTDTKTKMPRVTRTAGGLRDALFDELDAIRAGESNPTRANAVAKLSSSVVDTVRMELDVLKYAKGSNTPPVLGATAIGGEALALGQ